MSLASHVQVAQLETYDPKLNQNKNHRISITKLYNSTQKLRRIETNFRLQHYSYSKNPIFHWQFGNEYGPVHNQFWNE